MAPNPLQRVLTAQGYVMLDGGSATTLEARGRVLDERLWSARLLLDAPDAVRAMHQAFLEAGADCISTLSYQASFEGFARLGLSDAETVRVLRLSVSLAQEAKRAFWSDGRNRGGRREPIVAASAGPYGAYLADGSEYRGRYGVTKDALREFHARRCEVLADAGADVVAFETIPALEEADAIADIIRNTDVWAWVSFSCRDGRRLWDGRPLSDAIRACLSSERLAGVGVNCTHPRFIDALIAEARAVTVLPIIVYPNSGETYDARLGTWTAGPAERDWSADVRRWAALGARVIGGCCRVGPGDIRTMRTALDRWAAETRPLPPPNDRV